jgi:GNAT superfamily N-acetyltransferase
MDIRQYHRDGYLISTDKSRLDVQTVHGYLSRESYWAAGRTLETVQRSIGGSLCLGRYDPQGRQAGFARVITDCATFGWICDVFVLDAHKGRGLGKWLVQVLVDLPELRTVRRLQLATRDAHELYRRYGGFTPLSAPEMWMERKMASA